jgi:predicted component of type VI protein secretion system
VPCDHTNFNDVRRRVRPRLVLSVVDHVTNSSTPRTLVLRFTKPENSQPVQLIEQVSELR